MAQRSAVVTVLVAYSVPRNNPRWTAALLTRMASSSAPWKLITATKTLCPTGWRDSAPDARLYDVFTNDRCGYHNPNALVSRRCLVKLRGSNPMAWLACDVK